MADDMRPLAAPCPVAPSPRPARRSDEDAAREDLALKAPGTPGAQGAMVMGTSPLYSCTDPIR